MKKFLRRLVMGIFGGLMILLWLQPAALCGDERFQVELYGGLSSLNPKDLNLLSSAEEQYNDFYFVQRQLYKQGYFVNDFPRVTYALPAGLRLKYHISPSLSFSVSAEMFSRQEELTIEGTFAYVQPTWSDTQTKAYDPFSLKLSGFSLMGGFHYRIPLGGRTDVEIGASAGWGTSRFEFSSTWTNTAHFWAEDYWEFKSVDGGTLEGDGKGNGFLASASLRLSRALGQRFGFFVEASGTYCRMSSVTGSGRETRLGIPGETSWEGTWGVKKEELNLYAESRTVYVPTNYWEGWTESQRDRNFVLDLSRVQLVFGLYFKF